MRETMKLTDLIDTIIQAMTDTGFADGTIQIYKGIFSRLQKLANIRKEILYSTDLSLTFIADSNHPGTDEYCHSRYCYHCRIIQFIESFIKTGEVDWTTNVSSPAESFNSEEFNTVFSKFDEVMLSKGLKANTREGYHRFVGYFLRYLSDKGYTSVSEIQNGDVVAFIVVVVREHYSSTSLGAHIPGLKLLLKMFKTTDCFVREVPEHLPKKLDILKVYNDEEHHRMISYLKEAAITSRDKAISLIALETGLRAIDICNMKLADIDWEHNAINITQEKTGKFLALPLKESIGNAIVEYLLNERPISKSDYVFLRFEAPFAPIKSHAACYRILFKTTTKAGVEANGRIFGTRITRHSTASRLLRQGVPLPVISEALGHSNPESSMRYITTDDIKLAECTLPLPRGGERHAR